MFVLSSMWKWVLCLDKTWTCSPKGYHFGKDLGQNLGLRQGTGTGSAISLQLNTSIRWSTASVPECYFRGWSSLQAFQGLYLVFGEDVWLGFKVEGTVGYTEIMQWCCKLTVKRVINLEMQEVCWSCFKYKKFGKT